jgi:hypothetical protein
MHIKLQIESNLKFSYLPWVYQQILLRLVLEKQP